MLNKYICPLTKDFDPLKELLEDLKKDFYGAMKEQEQLSKEKALSILRKCMVTLNLIYSVMKQALEDPTSDKAKQILQHIRLRGPLNLNITTILLKCLQMKMTWLPQLIDLLKQASYEKFYIKMMKYIYENDSGKNYFEKGENNFLKQEIRILRFLNEKILPTLLDPFFNEIKHHYKQLTFEDGL